MAKRTKMVRLAVDETSGVDHPAHLSEGWLVMKSADATEVEAIIDSLTETADTTKEDSVSEENTVVTEDAVVAETSAEVEAPTTESPADDKDARIAELEAEVAKMKADAESVAAVEVDEVEAFKKSAPEAVIKMMESLEKKAADAEVTLQKERDERADADAIAKAKTWSNLPLEAEKVGPALRRLSQIDGDLAKSVESILETINAQAQTSNLFAEIGKSADAPSDAYDRMTALAKAAVEAGVAPTMEIAMADVALANQDLYKQYLTEKGAK